MTAGSVPTSGTNPKPIVVKVKPSVIAKSTDYAGGCLFLTAFQLPIKHAVVDWTAATGLLKPSKVGLGISGFVTNLAGELGFSYGASTTGSFAGSSALNLFLDPASTTAIENCEANVPGTISSVTLDPAPELDLPRLSPAPDRHRHPSTITTPSELLTTSDHHRPRQANVRSGAPPRRTRRQA